MKRALVILLTIGMLFTFLGISSAEEVDVSSMPHDQLVTLYEKIQSLLFSQALVDGCEIFPGTYVANEELPAGTYILTMTGEGFYQIETHLVGSNDNIDFTYLYQDGGSFKITFKDGMDLFIWEDPSKPHAILTIKTFSFGK